MLKLYSTSETCFYSLIERDTLRDWRRRGFLEGVGVQADGRQWQYRISELVKLSVVRVLVGRAINLGDAFEMAMGLEATALSLMKRPEDRSEYENETLERAGWYRFTLPEHEASGALANQNASDQNATLGRNQVRRFNCGMGSTPDEAIGNNQDFHHLLISIDALLMKLGPELKSEVRNYAALAKFERSLADTDNE